MGLVITSLVGYGWNWASTGCDDEELDRKGRRRLTCALGRRVAPFPVQQDPSSVHGCISTSLMDGCAAVGSSPPRHGSRPAGTHALNDDVVIDGADARRGFGSELGCFLLLDRVDKAPKVDGAVLNRDGQHGRPPRL